MIKQVLATTGPSQKLLSTAILVSALGYFVDVYDLLLFSILRIPSLKDLGLTGDDLVNKGVLLLNMQMGGMLLGGLVWGIWGDKRGRVKVLFGSILLYSIANIANAFVDSIWSYAFWRFLAGVGLAGEIGAGITLVSEMLPSDKRGYGTTIIATVGVSGALVAGIIGELFHWRTAYLIGGGIGVILLILRVSVHESGLFVSISNNNQVSKGDLRLILFNFKRLFRYINCIVIGLPIWHAVGIIVTFSPEIAVSLGILSEIKPSQAIFWCYCGLTLGDLSSGLLSQLLKSRKKAIFIFLSLALTTSLIILHSWQLTPKTFYSLIGVLGFSIGYWAVFLITAAENFGTNIRSTVATTVPNFVRAGVIPFTLIFNYIKPYVSGARAAELTAIVCYSLAFTSLYFLRETFSDELDYLEEQ